MPQPFDYYVILAEMRTGSNLLEQNLSAIPGVLCYGEAYNPSFIGKKKAEELFGITLAAREADPLALLQRMVAESPGLPGFRFFHDHDPRVLAHVLEDRRCAKIVLSRNPIESYVSLKIAGQTGQWILSDLKRQKQAKARFDGTEFARYLDTLQGFQLTVLHALQVSGQTAFYIDYEDLGDLAVLNGLAAFLGVPGRAEALPDALKKQNPEEIADKVENPEEMAAGLARLDRFNLARTPNFEPRRGAGIPGMIAGAKAPLLYMPIRSGIEDRLTAWLAALGEGVADGFTQKTLRQWRRANPGHRSFTVLRHPLVRAYDSFCRHIVEGRFAEVRQTLRRLYKTRLPQEIGAAAYDLAAHRAAFLDFLRFVKGNLNGQTSLRTDACWARQLAHLQGFGHAAGPDLVIREDRLAEGLAYLAAEIGRRAPPLPEALPLGPFPLAAVADAEIEAACQEAYQRDFAHLSFGDWRG